VDEGTVVFFEAAEELAVAVWADPPIESLRIRVRGMIGVATSLMGF
jgi:hypothetical protein